jgi:hypothetical protein
MRRLVVMVALWLAACEAPKGGSKEPTGTAADPVTVCSKEGQNCVFTPGKLGVCTMNMQQKCDGGFCFSCMSLH